MVETLLDSNVTILVLSSKFVKNQGFKLAKIKRPIYVRNLYKIFNKEELIENSVKINIF